MPTEKKDVVQKLLPTLRNSNHLWLVTFAYLPGCDLFHKIALLNKFFRRELPSSGLLDQIRVIKIKAPSSDDPTDLPLDSLKYALELADSLLLEVKS